jgi:hypothetical protein
MKEHTTLLSKKLFIFLIPSIIGIAYLGSTVLSSSTKSNKAVVRVNNLTRSFEVLKAEIHQGHVHVSLRNNSDKAIMTYVFTQIEPPSVGTFREEFANSELDLVIAPGRIVNKELAGFSLSPDHPQELNLNLAAIIFEDKSSEGDPKIIHEIEEERLGEKIQLMRVLPILDRLLSLSDAEMVAYFNQTAPHDFEAALNAPSTELAIQLRKERIQQFSLEDPDQFVEKLRFGLKSGRESVLHKYQELKEGIEKQGWRSLRDQVSDTKQTYEKIVARL